MCGRYVATTPTAELARMFGTVPPLPELAPTWNMAPTQPGPVVRRNPRTEARHLDALRWGLVPHWARDPAAIRHPINARSETAATAPMFREALRQRRCLVPADAFYEWTGDGRARQAHAIARADGTVMAFAGLWESWRAQDGTVLRSYTLLTTTANAQLAPLHERMTVVLEPADWPVWLGEAEGDWAGLLRPSGAEFRVWAVGPAVGNVRNDGPRLLAPCDPLGNQPTEATTGGGATGHAAAATDDPARGAGRGRAASEAGTPGSLGI